MDWKNKRVVVIGIGKSGKAAADLLSNQGADICLYDGKVDMDVTAISYRVVLGEVPEEFATYDCAVSSPGVPMDSDVVRFFTSREIPVIGEVELAYGMDKGTVVAITGTNGKTTTTTLMGEIMKSYHPHTIVVGNIGTPYTECVKCTEQDSVTVAEISSFQLETVQSFHPHVSAILNITPDHLNRHKTMENYINTKFEITANQTPQDFCILNYEDEVLVQKSKEIKAKILWFSSKRKVPSGMYLDEDRNLMFTGGETPFCNVEELKLLGNHNYENYMAAILMAHAMNVPEEQIRKVCKEFGGVEHRVEFVREFKGVTYYNDSKGTNPDAAIKGIQSMNRQTVLIGGGYDKGVGFEEWIQAFDGKVKCLLLMGETADMIEETAKENGFYAIRRVNSLKEAVSMAYHMTEAGEAVLLSPACASWDMFTSYEERGDMFKKYVNCLE